MASWLPETLFEIVGQGPAPSKDYYQLLVTRSQKVGIYRGDAKHKISAFKEICIKHLLCARCDTLRKNDSQPVALQDVPNSSCEIAVDQKCLLWDALLAQLGECSALDLGIGSANLMLDVEITKKINSKKIRLLKVIFRWWKISLRSEYRSAKPGETKDSHGAFLENSHLQVQIALIFGARILDYVFNLCEGKFDFLERLSDNLLLSIISYLDLEDIARLSQTSRRFAKLCTCDKLWEKIVLSACDTVTPDMRALAEDMGWRQMFFTNKLQLQRRLRKRRQGQGSHRNSQL